MRVMTRLRARLADSRHTMAAFILRRKKSMAVATHTLATTELKPGTMTTL